MKLIMSDNWSTPNTLFKQLHNEFQFNLDACANKWNNKCAQYFTEQDNALKKEWSGVVWMNPPYSECGVWIRKAFEESRKGATIVCLIPGRTETKWFHECCIDSEIRFVKGRIHFEDEDGKTGRPRFSSIIVIMRPIVYDSGKRSVIQTIT